MEKFKEFNTPELITLTGIAGSGKSTWIKNNKPKWKKTVVISTDELRKKLTGDISNQKVNPEVYKLAKVLIINNLKKGKNVVLDSTNVDTERRIPFIKDMEKEVDFKKTALIFYVSRDEAKKRIKNDIENNVDRPNVPEKAIDEMYQLYLDTLKNLPIEGFKIVTSWNENRT